MAMRHPFTHWAELYDRIYAHRGKDYAGEVAAIHTAINAHAQRDVTSVLDVGCGTGSHLQFLQKQYEAQGLDCNHAMLRVAQRKCPNVLLHQKDMTTMQLPGSYDAMVCLFGSINYLADADMLRQTARAMAGHLSPGGVLLIEPAILPERLSPPRTDVVKLDEPDLRLTRTANAKLIDQALVITFAFEITHPVGIDPFTETHTIRLFDQRDFEQAMHDAGLHVTLDAHGLAGKGLFIGLKL